VSTASPIARRPAARRAVAFFVQSALRELQADVDRGQEVPFSLDARRPDAAGPALYEYRPLFRAYIQARLAAIEALPDFDEAIASLADDPAVLAASRDHATGADRDAQAVRDAILVPLLVGVAERCGGFDFDDAVFDGIFDRMLADVAHERLSFTAFAPLTGVRGPDSPMDLGHGVIARRTPPSELADAWPECQGLLPDRFGIARDRLIGLELDLSMARGGDAEPPDAARRFARAVLALRLVHGGPIAAGPCVFERIDWSPRAVRTIAASVTQALPGEPARIDPQRLPLVRAMVDRIADAEVRGGALAIALARWAAASGAPVPAERATGLVAAIEPLLGADNGGAYAVAMRAAALVGAGSTEREEIVRAVRDAGRLARPDAPLGDVERIAERVGDVARSVLVAALDQGGDAIRLAETLDAVLLGTRPRPQVVAGIARSA
jgi:hypothetical protein